MTACNSDSSGSEISEVPDACGLASAGVDRLALTDLGNEEIDAALEALARFANDLKNFEMDVERRTFDVEALAAGLTTRDAAVEFVQREIQYEPYEGVLRGARGTLESRAGNHADRALLLQALLEIQGQETRLVRAEIGKGQATALVDRLATTEHLVEESTVRAVEAHLDLQEPAEGLGSLVSNIETSAFPRPSASFPDVRDAQIADSSDYIFLEMLEGDEWRALHTLDVEVDGFGRVLTEDDMEQLAHRFEIKMINGWVTDGVAGETVVLEYVAAVSDLFGSPLTVTNVHITAEDTEDEELPFLGLDEMLANSLVFRPFLSVNGHRLNGQEFDLGADGSRLVRQRLEILLHRPDGVLFITSRDVYRRSRDGASDMLTAEKLAGSHQIGVMGGSPDPTRVALDVASVFQWIGQLADPPESLGGSFSGGIAGPSESDPREEASAEDQLVETLQAAGPRPSDLDAFFLTSDRLRKGETYRHLPAVVIHSWQPGDSEVLRSFDIVTNPARPLTDEAQPIAAGVSDSILEACVLDTGVGPAGMVATNTSAMVGIEGGFDVTAVDSLEAFPIEDASREELTAMARDLATGATLDVFRDPESGRLAWWATTPSNGSVIARNSRGGHASQVYQVTFEEAALFTVNIGMDLLSAIPCFYSADEYNEYMYCVAIVAIGFSIGLGVGGIVKRETGDAILGVLGDMTAGLVWTAISGVGEILLEE